MRSIRSIKNKGSGAGGRNTNIYGLKFEEKTDNETRLLDMGFEVNQIEHSKCNYLKKTFPKYDIIFVKQYSFIAYLKHYYDIEAFRKPDEAYIYEVNDEIVNIKIIEKKSQYRDGSVETKLWASPSLKREYELIINTNIEYCLCLNKFISDRVLSDELKYKTLDTILDENNIRVLFGDEQDYFETLDDFIFD